MTIFHLILISIAVIYVGFFTLILISFFLTVKEKRKKNKEGISILIPFKNEAKHLETLCRSINQITFDKDLFEVIFINDHSNDNSEEILNSTVKNFAHQIINNNEAAGKKRAIDLGIAQTKFNYILTLDADCIIHPNLLSDIDTNKAISIGIALKQSDKPNLLNGFQEIESLMLGAVTIGTAALNVPTLSSGANLGYNKKVYSSIDPYHDNYQILSGDDMFLLKKFHDKKLKFDVRANYPVITKTEGSLYDYLMQVTRWAGKSGKVNLIPSIILAIIVFLMNLVLIASFFDHLNSWKIIVPLKFAVDFLLLFLTAAYYKRLKTLWFSPLVFVFYPFYLVVVAILINSSPKKA